MEIKITPLEVNSGNFEGNDWRNVIARYNGKLTKFKVDKTLDLSKYQDEEITVEYEVAGSASVAATIRIVKVI